MIPGEEIRGEFAARNAHIRLDGVFRRLDKLESALKIANGRIDRFKQVRRESNERVTALEAIIAELRPDFVPVRPLFDAHLERVAGTVQP